MQKKQALTNGGPGGAMLALDGVDGTGVSST